MSVNFNCRTYIRVYSEFVCARDLCLGDFYYRTQGVTIINCLVVARCTFESLYEVYVCVCVCCFAFNKLECPMLLKHKLTNAPTTILMQWFTQAVK